MSYTFTNSTAISSISDVVEGKVDITWTTGKTYSYNISDAEQFASMLSEIVSSGGSVGRFVNSQIQQNVLQLANAWLGGSPLNNIYSLLLEIMTLTTVEKVSPFSLGFTWEDYTNYLYRISDDYGMLTVGQMHSEARDFKMEEINRGITFPWSVEDFVDYLYDAKND